MPFETFSIRRVGTSGCEVRDPDGNVVAWAADEPWAAIADRLARAASGGSAPAAVGEVIDAP